MVVFVNKNYDRLARNIIGSTYNITETRGETFRFDFNIILLLPYLKLIVKNILKITVSCRIIVSQAKCQYSMRLPLRLKLLYGKSLEQFLFPFKICLERGQ